MLFTDKLSKFENELRPLFNDLFNVALKNQPHKGDLLLIHQNALIVPSTKEGLRQYSIGNQYHNFAEDTHINFIGDYIKTYQWKNEEEFKKQLSDLQSSSAEESAKFEVNSIQIEMLIYLKIFESDTFITSLYHLSRALNKLPYDWTFKLGNAVKEGNTRSYVVEKKIIPMIGNVCQPLSESLDRCYKRIIRNAIAHSQYWIMGDYINWIFSARDSKANMSKSDWTALFNETIAFHGNYITLFKRINDYYFAQAKEKKYKAEIRISWPEPNAKIEHAILYTREVFEDWTPHCHKD